MSKEDYFKAILEIHKQKSIDNISVRDIAKKLDVAVGSLYYYFKSKNDLLNQMYVHYRLQMGEVVEQSTGSTYDILNAMIVYDKENKDIFKFIFSYELTSYLTTESLNISENIRNSTLEKLKIDYTNKPHIPYILFGTLNKYITSSTYLNSDEEEKLIHCLIDIIEG